MELALSEFAVRIRSDIFLKDPQSSSLGIQIIKVGIELIDEIGFEDFTFKKLAIKINSTEASLYRYFENKQKFLIYLTAWYWGWIEFQLVLKNANIDDPVKQLQNAISILAYPSHSETANVDHVKLFNIISIESSKIYLIKDVDNYNKNGAYYNFKKLVSILSDIILKINPTYPYPHMLISTITEGIHHQLFFAAHLPSLTDKKPQDSYLGEFYFSLAMSHLVNKFNI